MSAKLPKIEITLYFSVWISAVAYSCYNVFQSGKVLQNYLDSSSMAYRWTTYFITRNRDGTEYDWEYYFLYMKYFFFYLLVNALITEVLRQLRLYKIIPFIHVGITTLFVYVKFGPVALIFLYMQPISYELCSKFNSKSVVWFCTIINHIVQLRYNIYVAKNWQHSASYLPFAVLLTGLMWMMLRCLSFYIDRINKKEKTETFLQVLGYCFYPSLMNFGPFIFFEDYKKCFECVDTFRSRFLPFIFKFMRFTFWYIVMEVSFHFFYSSLMSHFDSFVSQMDNWTLYGFGYSMGQFFHLKYVIIYGVGCMFAELEGMSTPPTPKCIGRIHLYSDMWKYFDVGLHRFLVKYLYIPTNGSKTTISKIFATIVCFAFIFIWHGMHEEVLIWSMLNLFGILCEFITNDVFNHYLKSTFEEFVSPEWQRRIFCIVASPLLALSVISNFYFFSNTNVGNIFLHRYLYDSFFANFILLFCMYCMCQVSTEMKNIESNTKKEKFNKNL